MIVVGISGGLGHDAACCLVRDGELLAMAEEERFVRQKRARKAPPALSLLYCLNEAGIELSDVDVFALSWDPSRDKEYSQMRELLPALQGHEAFRYESWPAVIHVPHHVAHAAASYFTSGLDEASILVIDGQGELESTTWALGKGNQIQVLEQWPVEQSAVTRRRYPTAAIG